VGHIFKMPESKLTRLELTDVLRTKQGWSVPKIMEIDSGVLFFEGESSHTYSEWPRFGSPLTLRLSSGCWRCSASWNMLSCISDNVKKRILYRFTAIFLRLSMFITQQRRSCIFRLDRRRRPPARNGCNCAQWVWHKQKNYPKSNFNIFFLIKNI